MTTYYTLPMSMGRQFRGTRNTLVRRMDEISARAELEWDSLAVEQDESDYFCAVEYMCDDQDMWDELAWNLAQIDAEG